MEVVIVGDACLDVVARVRGGLAPASDTAASVTVRPGGSGANVAAWLAWLGVRVWFVGRVGDDEAGRAQLRALRDGGVDPVLSVDASRPTGTVVALVDEHGERTMVTDRGANDALLPVHLPDELFTDGRHLHLSGYTLLHAGSRDAGLMALQHARRRGMTVSVDASSAAPLRDVGPRSFLEWTAGADVCFANRDEARALSGSGREDTALHRLRRHYPGVLLKVGSRGVRWAGEDRVAASAVDARVVDTTGAGDALAAGFLSRWGRGAPMREVLAEATRVAAIAVSLIGGRPDGTLGE